MFSGLRSVWIRFRSWRTNFGSVPRLLSNGTSGARTGHACEKLSCETLDLAVGERDEVVALEEVEHALAQEVHDDADVASEVEAVSEVNATIPIILVIGLEGCENSKLDFAGIPILLYRSNDLYGDEFSVLPIPSLDDLTKGALSKKLDHLI
jgi:hypothetical protein